MSDASGIRSAAGRVALLLFVSGFCALVYQTAWLRLFRLIFGASTAASAAVLAIFMAGLGFGGLLLGKRADRHPSPLGLYATLEAWIALGAGLSPLLVKLVSWAYIALGGSASLGMAGSTIVRLILATLVLGLPTFLMGGTLPAVARAVERGTDAGRRTVGMLYAVNTLGAVLGVLLTTFFALEELGVRKTVWIAALLNLLVVLAARSLARQLGESRQETAAEDAAEGDSRIGWLVPFAAGLVGFAFLLMELVWYRMLAPLLGGSVYTFGLILAVALLGIGLGGLLYGAGESRRRPTLLSFAATCSLEALLIVLPFALGDRIAVLAALLRPMGGSGFVSLVGAWSAITVLVVLPAAIVAGYQFPLLIALLGEGRRRVGREVGVTYAANTLGAILGSIAGGFGLLPLLSAPGVWRLVVALLLGLALITVVAGLRAGDPRRGAVVPLAAGALGLLFCLATGPTAFWRHSPIGAGRVEVAKWSGPNDIRRSVEDLRRRVVWEADGVESSVALDLTEEYAFIVNGKADGSTLGDSPTQVMSGLVGAALHPDPKRVLVIGLGTGSTAGWLARVPSIERVDVVELEPAIEHVAKVLSKVNLDVLSNPKVHRYAGDGREFLLTTKERYDVIFSEPSNPYRAGIASLFSQDFYRAAVGRLRPGGIFLQWLQGYEMDAHMLSTAYATLTSVFPSVETWQIHYSDLLLIATADPLAHDFDRVRARMAGEPYRTALARTWGVAGAEGFYSGYLAAPSFAKAVGESGGELINTDDRPVLEFGFAKSLGRLGLFDVRSLLDTVRSRGEHRPSGRGAPLDWDRVGEMQVAVSAYAEEVLPDPDPRGNPEARLRVAARHAAARGQLREACGRWLRQPEPPGIHADLLLVAECLAEAAHPRLPEVAGWLAGEQPIEAEMIRARWHFAAGRLQEAADHLLAAFQAYRQDPWVYRPLVRRTLPMAIEIARRDRAQGARLFEGLSPSFSTDMLEQLRRLVRVWVARELGEPRLCAEAFAPLEPHPPWEERVLTFRYECYQAAGSPLAGRARDALETFRSAAPPSLAAGMGE